MFAAASSTDVVNRSRGSTWRSRNRWLPVAYCAAVLGTKPGQTASHVTDSGNLQSSSFATQMAASLEFLYARSGL
jgi:hypothetical protein